MSYMNDLMIKRLNEERDREMKKEGKGTGEEMMHMLIDYYVTDEGLNDKAHLEFEIALRRELNECIEYWQKKLKAERERVKKVIDDNIDDRLALGEPVVLVTALQELKQKLEKIE